MEKEYRTSNWGFILVFFQSISISGFWLHSRIDKWNMEEELTIFLAPLYRIFVSGLLVISFVISLIYFAAKLAKTRKGYVAIPVLLNVIVLIIGVAFFNEIKLREYNFNKYIDIRNEILEMIVEGELSINEKGQAEIPQDIESGEVERYGYVVLFKYGDQIGGYFCTSTGLLGTSSGYIYLFSEEELDLNLFSENVIIFQNREIILHQSYEGGWYFGTMKY